MDSTRPSSSLAELEVAIPAGIDTPALLVDLDVVETNVERMASALGGRGVALRPHFKTHKSVRLAQLQLDAGANGMTVGTLGEAEILADAGITDLFIAYPLWAAGEKARRLRELAARAQLIVGVDSIEGAEALGRAVGQLTGAGGVSSEPLRVSIEIDPGGRRTGVAPELAADVALAASRAGLHVIGAFTHGGHSYASHAAVGPAADDEVDALERAATALHRAGFAAEVLSAGSSPTAMHSSRGAVTEERPGTYVFNDRMQHALGAADASDIGLVVLATVVSTAVPGQAVVDAGAKTLSKDIAPYLAGFGELIGPRGGVVERVYDYHGVVSGFQGTYQLGEVVAIAPNHVCPVVNLFDELVIARQGSVVGRWPVDARGRSG